MAQGICINSEIVTRAKAWVGKSKYRFYREDSNPPRIVNCHTFVYWVFNHSGWDVPWTLEEQTRYGIEVAGLAWCNPADVILTEGMARSSGEGRVGHIGILTPWRVVHACYRRGTVVIEDLDVFLRNYPLISVRRFID